MARISIFGALTNIQMLVHTWLHGTLVGSDALGNRYYKGPARKGLQRERRWVVYADRIEASLVPPQWHGWLHYQTNALPDEQARFRQPWQKPHQQNLTGTGATYLPPGHDLRGGQRDAATGDYQPWQPPQ